MLRQGDLHANSQWQHPTEITSIAVVVLQPPEHCKPGHGGKETAVRRTRSFILIYIYMICFMIKNLMIDD